MKPDYINTIQDAERRFLTAPVTLEQRADDDGDRSTIEGYAFKFNSITTIGDYFREEILPGAADNVLTDDVRALFNHDANFVLARSNNGKGTLKLSVDDVGLRYSYITPDRSYARDLEDAIKAGDVSQSSFAFSIEEQNWIERDGELPLRQIKKLKRLYDVSPVTYPAYADATVGKRSLDALHTEQETKSHSATGEEQKSDVTLSLSKRDEGQQNQESQKEHTNEHLTVRDAQVIIYNY